MSLIGLSNTFGLGWMLLSERSQWQNMLRRAFLVVVSLGLYGYEFYFAVLLLQFRGQNNPIFALATLLTGIYGLGLVRAWELLGVHRNGLLGWLSPLRDVPSLEAKKEQSHAEKGPES